MYPIEQLSWTLSLQQSAYFPLLLVLFYKLDSYTPTHVWCVLSITCTCANQVSSWFLFPSPPLPRIMTTYNLYVSDLCRLKAATILCNIFNSDVFTHRYLRDALHSPDRRVGIPGINLDELSINQMLFLSNHFIPISSQCMIRNAQNEMKPSTARTSMIYL